MAAITRKDYYSTLQVPPEASPLDLKKAYHRLAVLWHPDRNPGSQMAEERFKAVAEAYAVLSDPKKRKRYDEVGHEIFSGEFTEKDIFQGFQVSDLFKEFGLPTNEDTLDRLLDLDKEEGGGAGRAQDFFGGFGQGKGERRPFGRKKAGDLSMPLYVSLREAVYGGERMAAFNTLKGVVKARVSIPPGTESESVILLRSLVPGARGEEKGDLSVTVKVLPNQDFQRRGQDLLTRLPLSPQELKDGASPVISTLDGKSLRICVAPGTSPGSRLKVAGHGVPSAKGAAGSLIVSVELKD